MKKIVPFTNDIKFNTQIYEITSISLEHNLKLNNQKNINGEFIISGDYKITDSSLNTEPFIYGLPFDISMDEKYDSSNLKIDVDDFNFEIVNDEILRVNISILIDGIEIKEEKEIIEELIPEEKEESEERIIMNTEKVTDLFKEEKEEVKEVTSIFDSFNDDSDKYVTYHVHI